MQSISEYGSEDELINQFTAILNEGNCPWGELRFSREFYYMSGRTDVIAVDEEGRIFAFEGKLLRWKKALEQAYRNLCFAHTSYVILPKEVALRAFRFEVEFRKRGIGICYVEGPELNILVEAKFAPPLQSWLSALAFSALGESDAGHI